MSQFPVWLQLHCLISKVNATFTTTYHIKIKIFIVGIYCSDALI